MINIVLRKYELRTWLRFGTVCTENVVSLCGSMNCERGQDPRKRERLMPLREIESLILPHSLFDEFCPHAELSAIPLSISVDDCRDAIRVVYHEECVSWNKVEQQ